MNWLIIDGLKRGGYTKEAVELTNRTLSPRTKELAFTNIFHPEAGHGAGISPFS